MISPRNVTSISGLAQTVAGFAFDDLSFLLNIVLQIVFFLMLGLPSSRVDTLLRPVAAKLF
jgi:hypothetical protein